MTMTKQKTLGASAIDLLKADHVRIRTALSALEKATGPARRTELLARTKEMIVLHAEAEESIFYPAFRDAAETKEDKKLFFEAHEEHSLVDIVLEDLKGAPTEGPQFAAKAKVLRDLVEHHAEEEEQEMFPRARKLLDAKALKVLGAQLAEFKRAGALVAKR